MVLFVVFVKKRPEQFSKTCFTKHFILVFFVKIYILIRKQSIGLNVLQMTSILILIFNFSIIFFLFFFYNSRREYNFIF